MWPADLTPGLSPDMYHLLFHLRLLSIPSPKYQTPNTKMFERCEEISSGLVNLNNMVLLLLNFYANSSPRLKMVKKLIFTWVIVHQKWTKTPNYPQDLTHGLLSRITIPSVFQMAFEVYNQIFIDLDHSFSGIFQLKKKVWPQCVLVFFYYF